MRPASAGFLLYLQEAPVHNAQLFGRGASPQFLVDALNDHFNCQEEADRVIQQMIGI